MIPTVAMSGHVSLPISSSEGYILLREIIVIINNSINSFVYMYDINLKKKYTKKNHSCCHETGDERERTCYVNLVEKLF